MKTSDLFIGCFPGCTVVSDMSRCEDGDYKKLAYVSHAGNIKLFVEEESLPAFVREKIRQISKENRKEFDEAFERNLNAGETSPHLYRLLDRMMDVLTPSEFIDFCRKDHGSARNRCLALRDIYMERS